MIKKFIFLLLFLLQGSYLLAQGSLVIGSGSTITSTGGAVLTLSNAKLTNNGTFTDASGTVIITGNGSNTNAAIEGIGTTTFKNLTVNKSSNNAQLNQNIAVNGTLRLTSGGVSLSSGNIIFGSTGSLQDETETNRVFGTGGYLQTTVNLNAPSNNNPANLGAIISSSVNLGNTIIKRTHAAFIINGASINRAYDIQPSNNSGLNATLKLTYFDAELNGNTEANLGLWQSANTGTSWLGLTSSNNGTSNFIQGGGIETLGLFTGNSANVPATTTANPTVICSGTSTTLSATCTSGTVSWYNQATGGTAIGTGSPFSVAPSINTSYYASCLNGNNESIRTTTGLVTVNSVTAQASNTGGYMIGQTIMLSALGGTSYSWTGPNNFSSTSSNPNIANAQVFHSGIYTLTAFSNGCSATTTTNVVVTGIDPCVQIMEYSYVQAGNPYMPLFALSNGQNLAQNINPTAILVRPICPAVRIESVDMTISGPGLNWTILQNIEHFALFDNLGNSVNGQVLAPGTYSLIITGYAQDNRAGGITYGPVVTNFTIVGNTPTISMPTFTGTSFCAGTTITANFSSIGVFTVANQYNVLLSDENGSFNSPSIIGTTNTTGNVFCTIPANAVGGANYRMKVVSTDVAAAGNYNPVALTIHPRNISLLSPTNDYTNTSDNSQKAVNNIVAINKIVSSNVTYEAGSSIVFNAGFSVNASSVFKAEIKTCTN